MDNGYKNRLLVKDGLPNGDDNYVIYLDPQRIEEETSSSMEDLDLDNLAKLIDNKFAG